MQYKKTSHVLHFILTVLTSGFWVLPWLVIWASNQNHNSRVDQQRYFEMAHHNHGPRSGRWTE
ncbi:hypothetical protein phiK7A1_160 [Pseudomonas phage phiK7A1]|uniref:Uncharacterized protein n=1 Tax=Pseudomonas phage phiK7A1 TaxID=2759194 RepID=A0A7H0XG08_9CAUD|nr:hypothetical protein phiK7A1_160 [Pseudomonas phage phiK7A1]